MYHTLCMAVSKSEVMLNEINQKMKLPTASRKIVGKESACLALPTVLLTLGGSLPVYPKFASERASLSN